MVLKLGMGTVTLVGSYLLVKDEITILTFFMFLLVVTRMYEPLQISLQNLSAMISLDTNCKRMDEILSHEEQTGVDTLTNEGYDIVFDHVAFSYNQKEKVLSDVSFVAKQGEVTALGQVVVVKQPFHDLLHVFMILIKERLPLGEWMFQRLNLKNY